MLFTSLQYILFLPMVVTLYWIIPKQWRLVLLLLASYYFYASWIPAFLLLIFGLTVFNFFIGSLLYKTSRNRKALLAFGVGMNLLCLGFFKYTNFILSTLNSMLNIATQHSPDWQVNIILPLGISFFVFEFIHYLCEVYKGGQPIRSFVLFALFAAFFPTQIAGPIKRYADFEAQMKETKKLSLGYLDEGIPLIIQGMSKKLLLANVLAIFVQMGYATSASYGALELWLFAYAFALQIYFDFSGYTDIARGSALLFGYHIPINFNLPYIARNISDFWHRWHISLSSWLKDYLFIPLGGSRCGHWLTNRNLLITMSLGGLWHGASWNFLVWGVYHGLALIAHREFVGFKSKAPTLASFVDSGVGRMFSCLLTFHVVCIGWVFFRVHNIGEAFAIVKKMVLLRPLLTPVEGHTFLIFKPELPLVVPVALITVATMLLLTFTLGEVQERGWISRLPVPVKALYPAMLFIVLIILLPDSQQPFIYFQF